MTRTIEVSLLSDGIDVIEQVTTRSDASDLNLRGRNALYDRGEDNVRLSTRLFRQAVALDPEYAPVYTGLDDVDLITTPGAMSVNPSLPKSEID